jgi:hypothetical protein
MPSFPAVTQLVNLSLLFPSPGFASILRRQQSVSGQDRPMPVVRELHRKPILHQDENIPVDPFRQEDSFRRERMIQSLSPWKKIKKDSKYFFHRGSPCVRLNSLRR